MCVLCWWWWYKQKVLNYIHSSTACLVCTIILTVSDFLFLKKVLRTRLNNLLFLFLYVENCIVSLSCFLHLPLVCTSFFSTFSFRSRSVNWGKSIWNNALWAKMRKKRSFNSAVQNYRFYCIQYEEYIVANFTDGQCGEVFYFVPFNIFFYSKV